MYVTAQHVTAAGAEGINAFRYAHGPLQWFGLPPPGIPDHDPGLLENELISIQPGGNRVRSYLDIIAPDDTPWNELRRSFIVFLSSARQTSLPWQGVQGRCTFRIDMDRGLVSHWQGEVAELFKAARTLVLAE